VRRRRIGHLRAGCCFASSRGRQSWEAVLSEGDGERGRLQWLE
jgi:hypothetical protein